MVILLTVLAGACLVGWCVVWPPGVLVVAAVLLWVCARELERAGRAKLTKGGVR